MINPNLGGTTFELKEPVFVAGNFTGAQATWKRYQLGGWQSEFAEVVADITSPPMSAGLIVGTEPDRPWKQTVRPWVKIGTRAVEELTPIPPA